MRCLVTGASGHLGSYVVHHLLSQKMQVVAVVTPQSDLWRLQDVLPQIEILHADLANIPQARSALQAARPEIVFHLAWQSAVGAGRDDALQITRNVTGSLQLFEALADSGCHTWVGVGSLAEYGPYPYALREELPPQPVTAYGVAKLSLGLLMEKLCALRNMRYVWLRLTGIYGPHDHPQHLIPTVIQHFLRGESPPLTAGEQAWDYLYVEDAAKALCQAGMTPHVQGIFNLGSGKVATVRQIVSLIRDLMGAELALRFGELPYSPQQVMHLQADITRFQAALDWSPQVGLEEGLQKSIEWYRILHRFGRR